MRVFNCHSVSNTIDCQLPHQDQNNTILTYRVKSSAIITSGTCMDLFIKEQVEGKCNSNLFGDTLLMRIYSIIDYKYRLDCSCKWTWTFPFDSMEFSPVSWLMFGPPSTFVKMDYLIMDIIYRSLLCVI